MGSYLNPGNFSFRGSLRSKIYVDKSELLAKTNEALCTEQKYICVSHPRRFGKSMAANMLAAYYDRSENTEELFQNLAIREDRSYKENLNQYDVIKINMQEFLRVQLAHWNRLKRDTMEMLWKIIREIYCLSVSTTIRPPRNMNVSSKQYENKRLLQLTSQSKGVYYNRCFVIKNRISQANLRIQKQSVWEISNGRV